MACIKSDTPCRFACAIPNAAVNRGSVPWIPTVEPGDNDIPPHIQPRLKIALVTVTEVKIQQTPAFREHNRDLQSGLPQHLRMVPKERSHNRGVRAGVE